MSNYTAETAFAYNFLDGLLDDKPPDTPIVEQPTLSPVEWMEQNFYLYDLEQLITFHERQRRPLVEALREVDNQFVYNTILWSWPKKSAKSSVIAAICLYVLCNTPNASIALIANDQKQSDSRIGYFLREAIKIAKKKGRWIGEFKITPSGYRIENYATNSYVEMLPIDPNGEAGANNDLIVYSELHGWSSKAHQRMWAEMTLSPNKFARSRRIIDTYAGHTAESPILEMLYNQVVKPQYQIWGDDWEVYSNPVARLFATWVTKWLLPWQTNENGRAYYAEQASTLPPTEFDRMHRNQWTSSLAAFVPGEWWSACRGLIEPFGKYREMVVAVDAAVSGDCFGIVGLSRKGDKVELRYCRKWTPPPGGKIEYSNVDNVHDTEYPEGELRRLAKEYNVIAFGYDPYQLHHLCTSLSNENVGYFRPFSQGADRLEADKQLYDIIRDRRFVHDGNPDLTEHIQNANAKTEGDKLRIVKRSDSLKIDLAVCASMATELAFELLPE